MLDLRWLHQLLGSSQTQQPYWETLVGWCGWSHQGRAGFGGRWFPPSPVAHTRRKPVFTGETVPGLWALEWGLIKTEVCYAVETYKGGNLKTLYETKSAVFRHQEENVMLPQCR